MNKTNANEKNIQLELEKRWYASLEKGFPDYSVYTGEEYISEAIYCWEKYSSKYINCLVKENILDSMKPASIVVDLGCGVGYTTSALTLLFPNAKVYGTNIIPSKQHERAIDFGSIYGFEIVENLRDIKSKADVIFAFDYFEHFHLPIEHLEYVLDVLFPRHFVIANSFNTVSTGHFPSYFTGKGETPASLVGRLFNKKMRSRGYIKIETGFWNDRPTYWRLDES